MRNGVGREAYPSLVLPEWRAHHITSSQFPPIDLFERIYDTPEAKISGSNPDWGRGALTRKLSELSSKYLPRLNHSQLSNLKTSDAISDPCTTKLKAGIFFDYCACAQMAPWQCPVIVGGYLTTH